MRLEPCPFCRSAECHAFECDSDQWAVYCPHCRAIGPQASSADDATRLWNQAAPRATARQPEDRED